MRYSKAQLLELANECALDLELPPVSESAFESWIAQRLFEGAHPRGIKRGVHPEWTYPDSTLQILRLILALRSLGATRITQIVICLWGLGYDFPYDRIRHVLRSELRRIVKRQERGSPWFATHYLDLHKLTKDQNVQRLRQLPGLDADIAASGMALAPETNFSLALQAYWGAEGNPSTIGFPSLPAILLGIGGAIGPPGQSAIGGYNILYKVTDSELIVARDLFCVCLVVLLLMAGILSLVPGLRDSKLSAAFSKAANSFVTPEWIVPTLALFAISVFNIGAGEGGERA